MQFIARSADRASGMNSARRPPVRGSTVALSKSATPSNRPVRMNRSALSASYPAPPSPLCCRKPRHGRTDHTNTGSFAPIRPTTSFIPASTTSAAALLVEIVDPFEPTHRDDPDRPAHPDQTLGAAGPPEKGFSASKSAGPTTWLPPIPHSPPRSDRQHACMRRDKTSGQRSSPFNVEAVPSVIESPSATMKRRRRGAIMSRASRKYQEVVGERETPPRLRCPCAPAPAR